MPSRLIREGILTSAKVDLLTPGAEVFYRRLLNKVDDYGRYDARRPILRASLYPLRLSRVRETDCAHWLAECVGAGLIMVYEQDGHPLLQIHNTQWKPRSASKYPAPNADANNCAQLQTSARLDVDVVVVEDVEKNRHAPPSASPSHKGTRLPENWAPTGDQQAWARKERPDIDVPTEVTKFRNYWLSKTGKDATKLDWTRTFENWVLGAHGSGKTNGASAPTKPKPRNLMEPDAEGGRHE